MWRYLACPSRTCAALRPQTRCAQSGQAGGRMGGWVPLSAQYCKLRCRGAHRSVRLPAGGVQ
jgi:hypothetical protein